MFRLSQKPMMVWCCAILELITPDFLTAGFAGRLQLPGRKVDLTFKSLNSTNMISTELVEVTLSTEINNTNNTFDVTA